jgi:hypothetical protein
MVVPAGLLQELLIGKLVNRLAMAAAGAAISVV